MWVACNKTLDDENWLFFKKKGKCLEHLEMLILEANPFLVDPPPPWGKLKMCKVGFLTGNITYRAKCVSPWAPQAAGRGLYSKFI